MLPYLVTHYLFVHVVLWILKNGPVDAEIHAYKIMCNTFVSHCKKGQEGSTKVIYIKNLQIKVNVKYIYS